MRRDSARQIGGIEYQRLAFGFLAAGRGLFAVRPAKSTARQVCEKDGCYQGFGTMIVWGLP
jgi:hypothetical protein